MIGSRRLGFRNFEKDVDRLDTEMFSGELPPGPIGTAAWNHIHLIPPNGATVTSYPVTDAGLADAIAAATVAGSIIWVPPATFTSAITIPANIGLVALGEKVSINAQITLNSGVVMANVVGIISSSSGSALSGVIGPSSGIAYMKNCSFTVTNSGAGDAYAINQSGAGELWLWGCSTYGNASGGGAGYGVRRSAGTVYVTDDGRHRGSTGPFSGTINEFSFDVDVVKVMTPNGFVKLFIATAAGLAAAVAILASGDTLHLPNTAISGNYTIPAGVHIDGVEGSELTGTIIANPGVTISDEVKIPNLLWWDAPNMQPGGSLTLLAGITTITDDTSNNSFPALTKMADGDLIVVYRKGADHATSKGTLVMKTSSDEGATWSSESTVYSDATYDVRDPGILLTSTGRLVVSFYKYDHVGGSALLDGAYVTRSDDDGGTWDAPTQINSAFTDVCASGSSPPVELPDGTLRAMLQGMDSGDTYWSSSVVTSLDDGDTWGTEILVADGEADSRHYQEPNIVILHTGELLLMMRSDTPNPAGGQFYRSISRDTGLTWTDPVAQFDATGNPHILQTKAGMVFIAYRKRSDDTVVYRYSRDNGYSWSAEASIDSSTMFMTYASAWEYDEGVLGVAYAKEETPDDSNADMLFVRFYMTFATGQLELNVPDGTAPIVVDSTTLVTNLNADFLDGLHASEISAATQRFELCQDEDGEIITDENGEFLYCEVDDA